MQDDVELEASLLKALAVKSNYEKFYGALDTKKLLPVTNKMLKSYSVYFDKYNCDVDFANFYTEFTQNLTPEFDKDDIIYYRDVVFPAISNSRIENGLYRMLLERQATQKIKDIIEEGFDYSKVDDTVRSLKEQLNIYCESNNEDIFKLSDVDISLLDSSNGLSWFLPALQAGISSHMPGQFVLVSADSNAGKSAFCISQAVHVFRELHNRNESRPILYCTSEDTREDLAARFLSNLYNDKCKNGFEEIIQKYKKINNHFSEHYNGDLFIGMNISSYGDMSRIRSKIDKYNPCLIVIDMCDALCASLDIQCMTKTYNEIRALANQGIAVIGTTQAGNTSYRTESGEIKHRKWLTEKDTQGSKGGGKQGAAYCMIMIGMDDDMPSVRYLRTTKKKRGTNVSVTCQIDEKFSLYRELL